MNLSATLNVCRLVFNPQLCLPQLKILQFSDLKIPLRPEIKAIVLDKDNCFAKNHDDKVWPAYIVSRIDDVGYKVKNTNTDTGYLEQFESLLSWCPVVDSEQLCRYQ